MLHFGLGKVQVENLRDFLYSKTENYYKFNSLFLINRYIAPCLWAFLLEILVISLFIRLNGGDEGS